MSYSGRPDEFPDDGAIANISHGWKETSKVRSVLILRELYKHFPGFKTGIMAEQYPIGMSEYSLILMMEKRFDVTLKTVSTREKYLVEPLDKKYIAMQEVTQQKTKRFYYITQSGKDFLFKRGIPLLLRLW